MMLHLDGIPKQWKRSFGGRARFIAGALKAVCYVVAATMLIMMSNMQDLLMSPSQNIAMAGFQDPYQYYTPRPIVVSWTYLVMNVMIAKKP